MNVMRELIMERVLCRKICMLFLLNWLLFIGGEAFTSSPLLLLDRSKSISIAHPFRLYEAPQYNKNDVTNTILNTNTNTNTNTNGKPQPQQPPQPTYPQLKIAFVTGNEMKVKEMEMILFDHEATRGPDRETSMVDLRVINVDLPEIQEISTESIAKDKAIQGAQLAGGACVVEDTSLEFTALGGMPGPFIKWFQNKLQSEGLYNLLAAYDDKTATAKCTLAFSPYPHADPIIFTGTTTGTIIEPVPGRGFGWDSIFVPDTPSEYNNNYEIPFSCMSTEAKNRFSHRGQAVRQWADWLGLNHSELFEIQCGRPATGDKAPSFKSLPAE